MTVVAMPSPSTGVGSVVFTYDGTSYKKENTAPYAIAGDKNGDYVSWTPTVGTHSLKVAAYTSTNGAGTQLRSLNISFVVV